MSRSCHGSGLPPPLIISIPRSDTRLSALPVLESLPYIPSYRNILASYDSFRRLVLDLFIYADASPPA